MKQYVRYYSVLIVYMSSLINQYLIETLKVPKKNGNFALNPKYLNIQVGNKLYNELSKITN